MGKIVGFLVEHNRQGHSVEDAICRQIILALEPITMFWGNINLGSKGQVCIWAESY